MAIAVGSNSSVATSLEADDGIEMITITAAKTSAWDKIVYDVENGLAAAEGWISDTASSVGNTVGSILSNISALATFSGSGGDDTTLPVGDDGEDGVLEEAAEALSQILDEMDASLFDGDRMQALEDDALAILDAIARNKGCFANSPTLLDEIRSLGAQILDRCELSGRSSEDWDEPDENEDSPPMPAEGDWREDREEQEEEYYRRAEEDDDG